MGFIIKIIILALVVGVAYWAYGNYKIDTIDICVNNTQVSLPITCQDAEDCVLYLTSAWTDGYPRSDLYTGILYHVTTCEDGKCQRSSYAFKSDRPNDRCYETEEIVPFKVTLKDVIKVIK